MEKNPEEFFDYIRSKRNIKDTLGQLSNEKGTLTNDIKGMASISNECFDQKRKFTTGTKSYF